MSFKCKTCNDLLFLRGDYPLGHPAFGRYTPCPDCNRPAVNAECGLSERERKLRLAHIVTEGRPGAAAMLTVARAFMRSKTGMAGFYGNYGNGKTRILQAVVNECIEQGIEARYITATELIMWLKEAFDEKVLDTDVARIKRLAAVPVLCVDELDKFNGKPYAREAQQHIFDSRYRNANLLGTICAWNGAENGFGMPAVVSRFSEFGTLVSTNDPDMRPILGALKQKQREARNAG